MFQNSENKKQSVEYVNSVDAKIDSSLVKTINFFNKKNNIPTTDCCSGLLYEHYKENKLQQWGNNDTTLHFSKLFMERPYIQFEPVFHSQENQNEIRVNQKYYELKNRLSQHLEIAAYEDEFQSDFFAKWKIPMELSEKHGPYYNHIPHRYFFGCSLEPLHFLFQDLEYDIQLYDTIIEYIINSIIKRFNYSEIYYRVVLQINCSSGEIQEMIQIPHKLPNNFSESKFSEVEEFSIDSDTMYCIYGSPKEIYQTFCEKPDNAYHQLIQQYYKNSDLTKTTHHSF